MIPRTLTSVLSGLVAAAIVASGATLASPHGKTRPADGDLVPATNPEERRHVPTEPLVPDRRGCDELRHLGLPEETVARCLDALDRLPREVLTVASREACEDVRGAHPHQARIVREMVLYCIASWDFRHVTDPALPPSPAHPVMALPTMPLPARLSPVCDATLALPAVPDATRLAPTEARILHRAAFLVLEDTVLLPDGTTAATTTRIPVPATCGLSPGPFLIVDPPMLATIPAEPARGSDFAGWS